MEEAEVVAPDAAPAVETPAPEAPAAAQPAAPEAPKAPESRRDVLERAFKTPNNRGKHASLQPREQGKFAGPPQAKSEAPQVATDAPAAPVRPPLLKSLKRELEPHWNSAPPELLQAFAQREADFDKGAQTWKTKAEQADAVLKQFEPYQWMLQNEGATPQTAIAPLLQTAAILRTGTPAQKAQSVAQVMQQFGIPLDHIAAMFGQGNAPQPALDPHYNQLAQQVQSLAMAQRQQEQLQNQRALTVIEQFAADPANQHFAALQPKILALLQTPDLLGQDISYMSERERLALAYDTAVRLDPQLAAQSLAQQQAAQQQQLREKAQAAANAAKAAAVQVSGAPGAPLAQSANPNDRRSVIANALRAGSV